MNIKTEEMIVNPNLIWLPRHEWKAPRILRMLMRSFLTAPESVLRTDNYSVTASAITQ